MYKYVHVCMSVYECMFVFLYFCVCVYVSTHVSTYLRINLIIYLSIYLYYAYVASRQVEELQKMDTQECPVVVSSNTDTMDLSFLLCSSGM